MTSCATRSSASPAAPRLIYSRDTGDGVPTNTPSTSHTTKANCRRLRCAGRTHRRRASSALADDHLTPDQGAERGDCVGCIAGALTFAEYHASLEAAGFTDIQVTATHAVAGGCSAIIHATKPHQSRDTLGTDKSTKLQRQRHPRKAADLQLSWLPGSATEVRLWS